MATILIIDDLPVNRQYLVTLLGYGGHRLVEAGDGAEGLVMARATRPDLVIADLLMPTMDGFEFVRRLRTEPHIAHTPVIFITAHYLAREAQTLARECGVEHVLAKPAEPEEVLRAVAATLSRPVPPPAESLSTAEAFNREHTRLLTDTLSHTVDELRTTNERLQALIQLGLQLGSEREPARLLRTFSTAAREILGARGTAVGILDEEGTGYRHFLTCGLDPAAAEQLGALAPREGLFAALLAGERLRLAGDAPALRQLPGTADPAPVQAFLGMPISSPSRRYGWICYLDKLGAAEFSAEDEHLAGILAAQVGRIYENGSLYADLLERTERLEAEIRERERIEEQLRESEALFRSAFEGTHVSIAVLDLEGRFVRVNTSFAELFDHAPHELLQLTITDLVHPDDQEESRTRRAALLRGEADYYRTEKRFLRKDGTVVWGASSVSLMRDDTEAPVLFIAMVEDITARKSAEAALRATEGRLEHVVASSPAVLFTLAVEERELRPTWISPNLLDLLGYPVPEALEPAWWFDHIHPEDVESLVDTIQQELFTHDRVALDYRLRHQNGSYHWLRSELILSRDEAGEPLEVIGSWTDITKRVEADLALAERARLASMSAEIGQWLTQARDIRATLHACAESLVHHLDAAFARVWTVDETGETLELQASAGMYTHLDGPHARVPVGAHKIGAIARERRPHLTNRVLDDPLVADREWAQREGMVAFAGYPLIVQDRLIGVLGLFARHALPETTREWLGRVAGDIAIGIERKRTEEALEKSNDLLAETLSELRRAQSRIVEQERLRALGELASGVAHDFNNALSPIIGFTDLLLRRPANLDDRDRLISYLEIIRTAAEDGASVVRRLREFYRARSETDVFSAVDLNVVVQQSVELSRPRWKDQAQSRGVTVEVVTELGEVPPVGGDPAHLREVVLNLLFNAVDALPAGGRITLRTTPARDGHARLEVSDTGTGMTEEVRQRCLQPFFTTKGEQGTGLGLSMVYGIIQRHEGQLDIHTAPGEGTTVAITLKPFLGHEAPHDVPTGNAPMPSLRILVVDDEERVRRTTAAMLEAEGHRVVSIDSGAVALAHLHTQAFDLVVTDRAMPGMNGDQLAAAIRNQGLGVPVLMLTGFGDLMRGVEELPPGVDRVLSKPAGVLALREAILQLTQGPQPDEA